MQKRDGAVELGFGARRARDRKINRAGGVCLVALALYGVRAPADEGYRCDCSDAGITPNGSGHRESSGLKD
jgi:hypothetical protein